MTKLSKSDIKIAVATIHDEFEHIACQMEDESFRIPEELLQQWKNKGFIVKNVIAYDFTTPSGPLLTPTLNPFIVGRFHLAIEKSRDLGELIDIALTESIVKPGPHAYRIIEEQLDDYLKPHGEVSKEDYETIKKLAKDNYLGNWQRLSSDLYHAEVGVFDRDMLAYYLIHDVKGQADGFDFIDKYGPDQLVYKMPMPTACKACMNLYLEKDGKTPKLFKSAEMLAWKNNLIHSPDSAFMGDNYDGETIIPQKSYDNLKPVAGLAHSFCNCSGPYVFTTMEPWADKYPK